MSTQALPKAEVISGRSQPRSRPPERHDVRFWGTGQPDRSMRAVCEPCTWSVHLEGGHDAADLTRLDAMHRGLT